MFIVCMYLEMMLISNSSDIKIYYCIWFYRKIVFIVEITFPFYLSKYNHTFNFKKFCINIWRLWFDVNSESRFSHTLFACNLPFIPFLLFWNSPCRANASSNKIMHVRGLVGKSACKHFHPMDTNLSFLSLALQTW